jgi:hypothetical protein
MEDQGLVPRSQEWRKEDIRFRPDIYHLTVIYGPEEEWSGIRVRPSGTIAVRVSTPAEAKQAIAELKAKKKELGVQRRELTSAAATIRVEHRARKAGRAPAGKGMFADVARNNRRAQDQQVAAQVANVDRQKLMVDRQSAQIDRALLQLERMAGG